MTVLRRVSQRGARDALMNAARHEEIALCAIRTVAFLKTQIQSEDIEDDEPGGVCYRLSHRLIEKLRGKDAATVSAAMILLDTLFSEDQQNGHEDEAESYVCALSTFLYKSFGANMSGAAGDRGRTLEVRSISRSLQDPESSDPFPTADELARHLRPLSIWEYERTWSLPGPSPRDYLQPQDTQHRNPLDEAGTNLRKRAERMRLERRQRRSEFIYVDGLPDSKYFTPKQAGWKKSKDKETMVSRIRDNLQSDDALVSDEELPDDVHVFKLRGGAELTYYFNRLDVDMPNDPLLKDVLPRVTAVYVQGYRPKLPQLPRLKRCYCTGLCCDVDVPKSVVTTIVPEVVDSDEHLHETRCEYCEEVIEL
ncbi:hypothetical protein KFL_010150020 [Klebsormidium nitens]|uniref:Uncharacterized protein n=1 Tax=Klebsormidium nitens TaxID=105231 RepID=A0A1Y1INX8_KLENI|nr:hypothetical protein KFL_010150020 [Klebsormidium nitens]|eukprot:GAQ92444.1 hypothetical protein KFL_010150020 [Klebsormidium nitens]